MPKTGLRRHAVSVRHVCVLYSIKASNHILKTFFTIGQPHRSSFSTQNLTAIFQRGSPNGVCRIVKYKRIWKKCNFPPVTHCISEIIQDTYYGTPIRTRMQSIEWYRLQWSSLIFSDLGKYSMTWSNAWLLWDSCASCHKCLKNRSSVFHYCISLRGTACTCSRAITFTAGGWTHLCLYRLKRCLKTSLRPVAASAGSSRAAFLSASLYFSKRGAYWDRLCREVVGCHARALWPNGES